MLEFVKTDVDTIKREIVSVAEGILGETLFPGDERYMMLMSLAYIVFSERSTINAACNSNLLPYSYGGKLDALALYRSNSLHRLPAQRAHVTIEFTLSAVQSSDAVIPAGTRVSPDGTLFFASVQVLVIPPGGQSGTVIAEATLPGEAHNGFLPGQIKTIVDPVAFVASAKNVDASAGGSAVETDEAFKSRILTAPEGSSTAGPEESYRHWVASADINVADVSIETPFPSEVEITVLIRDGGILTPVITNRILEVINPRRPMTDLVTIRPPSDVPFDVDVVYYFSPSQPVKDEAAVERAAGEYIAWQSGALGRSILPEDLIARLRGAGAYRIEINGPAYVKLEKGEVARLGSRNVVCGGVFV